MDVKKIIKNFNERLRVARNKYGEDSRIVNMMIDRAKMVTELDWSDRGISTKQSNIESINTNVLEKRVKRYIDETSAIKIIKKTLTPEQIKANKGNLGEIFNTVMANKAICQKIWADLYDLGYSPEECNTVYDELMAGNYNDILDMYIKGSISLDELAQAVLNGVSHFKYDDIPEFDDF